MPDGLDKLVDNTDHRGRPKPSAMRGRLSQRPDAPGMMAEIQRKRKMSGDRGPRPAARAVERANMNAAFKSGKLSDVMRRNTKGLTSETMQLPPSSSRPTKGVNQPNPEPSARADRK